MRNLSYLRPEPSSLGEQHFASRPFCQTVLFIYFYVARYLPIHLTSLTELKLHKLVEHKDSIIFWVHFMLQLDFIRHCLHHRSALRQNRNLPHYHLHERLANSFCHPCQVEQMTQALKHPNQSQGKKKGIYTWHL